MRLRWFKSVGLGLILVVGEWWCCAWEHTNHFQVVGGGQLYTLTLFGYDADGCGSGELACGNGRGPIDGDGTVWAYEWNTLTKSFFRWRWACTYEDAQSGIWHYSGCQNHVDDFYLDNSNCSGGSGGGTTNTCSASLTISNSMGGFQAQHYTVYWVHSANMMWLYEDWLNPSETKVISASWDSGSGLCPGALYVIKDRPDRDLPDTDTQSSTNGTRELPGGGGENGSSPSGSGTNSPVRTTASDVGTNTQALIYALNGLAKESTLKGLSNSLANLSGVGAWGTNSSGYDTNIARETTQKGVSNIFGTMMDSNANFNGANTGVLNAMAAGYAASNTLRGAFIDGDGGEFIQSALGFEYINDPPVDNPLHITLRTNIAGALGVISLDPADWVAGLAARFKGFANWVRLGFSFLIAWLTITWIQYRIRDEVMSLFHIQGAGSAAVPSFWRSALGLVVMGTIIASIPVLVATLCDACYTARWGGGFDTPFSSTGQAVGGDWVLTGFYLIGYFFPWDLGIDSAVYCWLVHLNAGWFLMVARYALRWMP